MIFKPRDTDFEGGEGEIVFTRFLERKLICIFLKIFMPERADLGKLVPPPPM